MIVVQTAGLEEASIYINERLASMNTLGLMETVGALVEAQTKRRIASEKTAPDGSAWAPLKASTAARKGNDNILVDVGRLLGSISHIATATQAVVGTNVFYGVFHQGGTSRMPSRAFVGLSSENSSELEDVVRAFIASQLL